MKKKTKVYQSLCYHYLENQGRETDEVRLYSVFPIKLFVGRADSTTEFFVKFSVKIPCRKE